VLKLFRRRRRRCWSNACPSGGAAARHNGARTRPGPTSVKLSKNAATRSRLRSASGSGGGVVGSGGALGHLGRMEVAGAVRQRQERAGREPVTQSGDDPGRVLLVGDEVHDRDQQQRDGLPGAQEGAGPEGARGWFRDPAGWPARCCRCRWRSAARWRARGRSDDKRDAHAARYAPPPRRSQPTPESAQEHPDGPACDDDRPTRGTALWAALRDADPQGLSCLTELEAACGMSRSWDYYRLQTHARASRAIEVRHGYWHAVRPGDDPQLGQPWKDRPDAP
jgi:hypothetical protein